MDSAESCGNLELSSESQRGRLRVPADQQLLIMMMNMDRTTKHLTLGMAAVALEPSAISFTHGGEAPHDLIAPPSGSFRSMASSAALPCGGHATEELFGILEST